MSRKLTALDPLVATIGVVDVFMCNHVIEIERIP